MNSSRSQVYNIPFNRPFLTGKEINYILDAVSSGKISGNGKYTKKSQTLLTEKYGFKKVLLTNSCTDALEMASILANIQPGDEVILPSFTFVSTANAFALRGATLIYADCEPSHPNIDPAYVKTLITSRTKAIVVVHYAGIACKMDEFLLICRKFNLILIEDAAHAIDSFYKGIPLGSLGDLGTLSFHETKNVISGEGGALIVNNPIYSERSEVIWEKGTNRTAFEKEQSTFYTWIDIGSSFLPSDIIAAFLLAQLESIGLIQERRKKIWHLYQEGLSALALSGHLELPYIPNYASINGHMFYILCKNKTIRNSLINYLKQNNIMAIFHYIPLHSSPFAKSCKAPPMLPNTDRFSECLLRLPVFYEINESEIEFVIQCINNFFK